MAAFSRLQAWLFRLVNRNPRSNALVLDLAGLTPEDVVLDIGCGAGAALERAAGVVPAERVHGVDPTPSFVEATRQRVPGADIRLSTADELPWDSGTMSVVWTVSALHHWSPRDAGLAEAVRVLRPGGRFIVVERLLERAGHGLTDEEVASVSAVLRAHGARGVETSVHTVRRSRYVAITATI